MEDRQEEQVLRSWHKPRLTLPRVLILPAGHANPVRRLSIAREWMVGGVLGVVAALAGRVLVISFASSGPSSGHGCVYATIPGAVGAEQVHECGRPRARPARSVNAPGAYTRQAAHTLATECRKAGLPVG